MTIWNGWSDEELKKMMLDCDLTDEGEWITYSLAREELDVREEEDLYPFVQMDSFRR